MRPATYMAPRDLRAFFHRLSHHRAIRVTTEGTRFLLLTLAVGIAAVNTGNNLFYLLLAMMLSLIVLSGLLSEQCVRRLDFHRHLPDSLFVNQPAVATLWIANHKAHVPTVSVRILDVVAGQDHDRGIHLTHLAPGASTLRSYPLLACRRGRYHIEGIRVITPFPFGLFQKKAFYPCEASLLVCPAIIPLPPLRLQELQSIGHEQALARRGPGTSLYNLREFRPGDDSRAIHWLTTARTAKLMIKETEAEDQHMITLALFTVCPDELDRTFERTLSITASLVDYYVKRGVRLRLILGDQPHLLADGEEQSRDLFHALALCERRPVTASASVHQAMGQALVNASEGPTIWLSPWMDAAWFEALPAVDLILSPQTHKDLFDAAGSGLPA
ncbi:MAG: DUF58 domain-containing protein [Nitrospira sp.]|uniref:DUF58 domain-containing protein n=1 Tax=Nitrospira defluvii TaxID=330214 RepID=A0ABN7KQL8_9BACT|nr:DUF58 domain-containing protein [Nitrospira defluvii]MCS6326048.1 DUF58 domain-containing protein [Nitrospira sp.]CAE6705845.1 DUF58 domain-containing protein [Nitrospira defluvii]